MCDTMQRAGQRANAPGKESDAMNIDPRVDSTTPTAASSSTPTEYREWTPGELESLPYGDLYGAIVEAEPGARFMHLSLGWFVKTTTIRGTNDSEIEGYFGSVSPRVDAARLSKLAPLRLVRMSNITKEAA